MTTAFHDDYEHPTPDRAVCAGCGLAVRRAVPLAELAVPVTGLRPGDLVRFDGDPYADAHHDCTDPEHDHWWTHEYGVIGRDGPDGPSGEPDGPDHYLLHHHHTETRDDPRTVRFPAAHRVPLVGRVGVKLWADQPDTWHEPDSLTVCPTPYGPTPAHVPLALTGPDGEVDLREAVALYRETMHDFRRIYHDFKGSAADHEAAISVPEKAGYAVIGQLRAAGHMTLADMLRTEHERLGLLADATARGDRPSDVWRERAHDSTAGINRMVGLPDPGPTPRSDSEAEAARDATPARTLDAGRPVADTDGGDGAGKPRPGDPVTYLAANGHMVTTVIGANGEPVQWSAQHADSCRCGGEALPDW